MQSIIFMLLVMSFSFEMIACHLLFHQVLNLRCWAANQFALVTLQKKKHFKCLYERCNCLNSMFFYIPDKKWINAWEIHGNKHNEVIGCAVIQPLKRLFTASTLHYHSVYLLQTQPIETEDVYVVTKQEQFY